MTAGQATSETCPATVTVTQSGRLVSFAPLIEGGSCGDFRVELGRDYGIDANGTLDSRPAFTVVEPPCSAMSVTIRGAFSGRELHLTMTVTSANCPMFTRTVDVTR
jgi:hypothetical protein